MKMPLGTTCSMVMVVGFTLWFTECHRKNFARAWRYDIMMRVPNPKRTSASKATRLNCYTLSFVRALQRPTHKIISHCKIVVDMGSNSNPRSSMYTMLQTDLEKQILSHIEAGALRAKDISRVQDQVNDQVSNFVFAYRDGDAAIKRQQMHIAGSRLVQLRNHDDVQAQTAQQYLEMKKLQTSQVRYLQTLEQLKQLTQLQEILQHQEETMKRFSHTSAPSPAPETPGPASAYTSSPAPAQAPELVWPPPAGPAPGPAPRLAPGPAPGPASSTTWGAYESVSPYQRVYV